MSRSLSTLSKVFTYRQKSHSGVLQPRRQRRRFGLVRFRSPEAELVVFADGRTIVKGVSDASQARSVYARYVGS